MPFEVMHMGYTYGMTVWIGYASCTQVERLLTRAFLAKLDVIGVFTGWSIVRNQRATVRYLAIGIAGRSTYS